MRSLALLLGCFLLSAGTAVAGITYDPVCVNACDTDRAYCYQTTPECAEVDYCDVCENGWSSCLRGCQICTDPRSQTPISDTFATDFQWVGSGCYSYHWYELFIFTIKTCEGTRTQYCDGRIEESWSSCYDRSYGQCAEQSGGSCGGSSPPPAGSCPF